MVARFRGRWYPQTPAQPSANIPAEDSANSTRRGCFKWAFIVAGIGFVALLAIGAFVGPSRKSSDSGSPPQTTRVRPTPTSRPVASTTERPVETTAPSETSAPAPLLGPDASAGEIVDLLANRGVPGFELPWRDSSDPVDAGEGVSSAMVATVVEPDNETGARYLGEVYIYESTSAAALAAASAREDQEAFIGGGASPESFENVQIADCGRMVLYVSAGYRPADATADSKARAGRWAEDLALARAALAPALGC